MIIVVAALEFGSEKDRDEAVALTADVQRLTREEEPGCHDYCFAPDPAIPTRMQVYELWADSESLAAHFQHPYYQHSEPREYRADTWGCHKYHPLARNPPVWVENMLSSSSRWSSSLQMIHCYYHYHFHHH